MVKSTQKRAPKKRARRSQADIAANNFLKSLFKPAKKYQWLAWLCDVAALLLLVVQAAMLAAIFAVWLGEVTGKSAVGVPAVLTSLSWTVQLVILGVAMVGRVLLGYAKEAIVTAGTVNIAKIVRERLLNKLSELGLSRREFGADGVLASKIIDEPEHLAHYLRFEVQKLAATTTPMLLLGLIAWVHLGVAGILLASIPVVLASMIIIGIATARKSRAQMDAMAQLGGRFFDWIRGVNTLSRLQAVDIAAADVARSADRYRVTTMSVLRIAFLNSAALELVSALCIALVAVYLGLSLLDALPWQSAQVSYAQALFVLLLVPEFYAPLRKLGAEYHIKAQAIAAAKSVVDLLSFKPTQQGKQAPTLHSPVSLAFNKVAAFGDDGRVRLQPTTLSFAAGQCTALMGESGAGKSTILQILLGFGKYTGEVQLQLGTQKFTYDELDMPKVRTQFGYLAQTATLLPMSIAENLRLAKTDATDDELQAALQAVGLHSLIEALPHKMHTQLGERGGGISGGQVQRLAIAQLLLQDAKVWLLDEPTEHLDAQTAAQISALLSQLCVGKTVIWVTHDATVAKFDTVLRVGQLANSPKNAADDFTTHSPATSQLTAKGVSDAK